MLQIFALPFLALLLCFGSSVHAGEPFYQEFLRQEAQVQPAQAGTIAGLLSEFQPSWDGLSKGSFSYQLPLAFKSERGPLLVDILPTYDIQHGLGPWGLGWRQSLSLTRTKVIGDINYRDDQFLSPWGLLVQGDDGLWYPEGLSTRVRIEIKADGATAYGPDGRIFRFNYLQTTEQGVYSYFLSEVVNLLGQRTTLAYETLKNVVYLKQVWYGGKDSDLPYGIEFLYETLAIENQWIDFRSKVAAITSQKIKTIRHILSRSATPQLLWAYSVETEAARQGPSFYLKSLTKEYPSGKKDPALSFHYQDFQLKELSYGSTDSLRELASYEKSSLKLSFYDYNNDGLVDIETAKDRTLFLQTPEGFKRHIQFQRVGQNVCLGQESDLNLARKVLRLLGPSAEPLVFHADRSGLVTICKLNGEVLVETQLPFPFKFGENVLLADFNSDSRPDILHFQGDKFDVYANTSSAGDIRFSKVKTTAIQKVPSLGRLYSADINGDRLLDLVIESGSSLKVYMGKGNFDFTQTFLSLDLYREDNGPFDTSSAQLNLVDLNQDGLSDLLAVQGKSLFSFLSTGKKFMRVKHEAFEQLHGEGEVLIANILASGEQMIFRSHLGGVRFARLHTAQTQLLSSIDDGQGNKLSITFDYDGLSGPKQRLHKVLHSYLVSRVGEGTIASTVSYQNPLLRQDSLQRLGYELVTITSETQSAEYRYIAQSNQLDLRRKSLQDKAFPSLSQETVYDYQQKAFQGIPIWLRQKTTQYFRDRSTQQATIPHSEEVKTWTSTLCEEQKVSSKRQGTYAINYLYAPLDNFPFHLICIPNQISLDWDKDRPTMELIIDRNELLQERSMLLKAGDRSTLLQSIEYDPQHRTKRIVHPSGAYRDFKYVDDSFMLEASRDSIGQEFIQSELDARDYFERFQRQTDGAKYEEYFLRDGWDRLATSWTSLYGNRESPLKTYSYTLPTQNTLGSIKELVQLSSRSSQEMQQIISGSGYTVAQAHRFGPDTWKLESIQQVLPGKAETMTFSDRRLSESDLFDPVLLFQNRKSFSRASLWGWLIDSSTWIQEGVQQQKKAQLFIQDSTLYYSTKVQDHRTTTQGFDSDRKKLSERDPADRVTNFAYDALGRLRLVALPEQKKLTVFYDSLGRVENIEAHSIGSLRKFYNSKGLLSDEVYLDPASDEVYRWVYSYDEHGRLLYKIAKNKQSYFSYSYTYDGLMPDGKRVSGQVGYLSSITTNDYRKTFVYDSKGRMLTSSTVLPKDAIAWELKLHYNALDAVVGREFAARLNGQEQKLNHFFEYDTYNRLASIQIPQGALHLAYNDPALRLKHVTGLTDLEYIRDAKTGRRMRFKQKLLSQTMEYGQSFNAYGEVESEDLQTARRSRELTYSYSPSSFLESAKGFDTEYTFPYSLDGLLIADIGSQVSTSGPQGQRLLFDKLGRLLQRGELRLNYGPGGQVSEIQDRGDRYQFIYDEAGKPLLIRRNNQIYWLAEGDYSFVDGEWQYAMQVEGHLLGFQGPNGFIAKAFDFRGTQLPDDLVAPYGRGHLTQSRRVDYAGHPQLPELGLVLMGVRLYDPQLGQFLSPDGYFWGEPEKCLESPVECNLYSYAKNNPLKYTDPTGKQSQEQQMMNRMFVDQLKTEVKGAFVAAWTTAVEIPYKVAGNLAMAFDIGNVAGKDISGLASARDILARDGMPVQSFKEQILALPDSSKTEQDISRLSLFAAPMMKLAGRATAVDANHLYNTGLLSDKSIVDFGNEFSKNMSKASDWVQRVFTANDYFGAGKGTIDSIQSLQPHTTLDR